MRRIVHPVILSGGAGTRLWPLSRALRPKQLLPLVCERSMLQETVRRVTGEDFAAPVIVGNEEHRFLIAEQVRALGVTPRAIVLEPEGRNTAPAATVAALLLVEDDPDAIIALLPSDHVVADTAKFHAAFRAAIDAASIGALVTFGIPASRPETGYGYIRKGKPWPGIEGCWRIDRFVEKPDPATAESYVASGDYAWNSGMFVLPARTLLDEVERLEPEMLRCCRQAVRDATSDLDFLRLARVPFVAAPSISIDYAVMEHTDKGAVVAAEMGWNDVGSWSALWEISEKDSDGNALVGDVLVQEARNCYVRGDGNLVAAIGVDDLVIVATDDVVLVVPRDRAQEVKQIVSHGRAGRAHRALRAQPGVPPVGLVSQHPERPPFPGEGDRRRSGAKAQRADAPSSGGALGRRLRDGEGHARRGPLLRDREPVHLHSARDDPLPRKPRQDPAQDDRGAVRALSG